MAAFAVILLISLITGSLLYIPRVELALMTVGIASIAAAGIMSQVTRMKGVPKYELAVVLLLSFGFFLGGVVGAVWPRDSRAVTPYLSGTWALASLVFAGYWIRRYLKKTRPKNPKRRVE